MIDISVSGLVKEFEVGTTRILDGLTFQIDQGERVSRCWEKTARARPLF